MSSFTTTAFLPLTPTNQQSTQPHPYEWTSETSPPSTYTRHLTNIEHMFSILNHDLHGQNCPFFGATINILPTSSASNSISPSNLPTAANLHARAIQAFIQTRYRYPTLAARVVNKINDKRGVPQFTYTIPFLAENLEWAQRSVRLIQRDGGWLGLREELSRTTNLPTPDGDFCVVYIIVPLTTHNSNTNTGNSFLSNDSNANSSDSERGVTRFDILLHTHHSFFDGAGIRSVFNEFISRLAAPLSPDELSWGDEVKRLYPASPLLLKPEERDEVEREADGVARDVPGANPAPMVNGSYEKQSLGLPLYSPTIGPPTSSTRGTLLVRHTFDATFLPRLQAIGRTYGVKLAAMLHAALLIAVDQSRDTQALSVATSDAQDIGVYKSGSGLDLRGNWMRDPWSRKREYVNLAVVMQGIDVPAGLLRKPKGGIWQSAKWVQALWDEIKGRKGIMDRMEVDATSFIDSFVGLKTNGTAPTNPRTCPYLVSDPRGEDLLDREWAINEYEGLKFVLSDYQLATDQMQAVVSARSHSWLNRLTLCLVFNAMRNPKREMQTVLGKWVGVLEKLVHDIE